MPRIRLLPKALSDLEDIWLYTQESWGLEQAEAYTASINDAFSHIAEDPLACRERVEFEPPIRIHHHQHHLIVYITDEDRYA